MAVRVTEVQQTPNPNATKFVLDRRISEQPISFFAADAAEDHPVARRLFEIPGVTSVLLLGDFVTVNKTPQAKWADVTKRVKQVLAMV